jgi:hypothetical protein
MVVGVQLLKPETKAKWKAFYEDTFKWDSRFEKGFAVGLAFLMVFVAITQSVDVGVAVLFRDGEVPYGILWAMLNPVAGLSSWVYKSYLLLIQVPILLLEWKLVKMKRLSKVMFYMNWMTTILWEYSTQYENITVTMFAPFASINPLFTLLLVFQKLPLGWSWNFSDPHWACAFAGNGTITEGCPTLQNRIDSFGMAKWNFRADYILLAFWTIFPVVVWWWTRRKGARKQ